MSPFKNVKQLRELQYKSVKIGHVIQAESHAAITLKMQKETVKNHTKSMYSAA
jgi:hypothetical protein